MKIHLAWIRETATAAVLAGVTVQPSAAQYAPYPSTQQQPTTPAAQLVAAPSPRYGGQQPYWQQAAQQAQAPTYRTAMTPAAPTATTAPYPQTSAAYVPTATCCRWIPRFPMAWSNICARLQC